jgi:hypothetical protein
MRARVLVAVTSLLVAAMGAGVVSVPVAAEPSSSDYVIASTDSTGRPDRWFPCAPITWKIALNGAPRSELKAVRAALASVSRATRLTFSYAGESTFVATHDLQSATEAAGVDVLIGFARPGRGPFRSRLIGEGVAGYGGRSVGGDWTGYANNGGAIFNLADMARMSESARMTLYLHELGHVIGLGHTTGHNIMTPGDFSVTTWSRGDLAGLRVLGRQPGDCRNANDTAPITDAPRPVTDLTVTARPDGSVVVAWRPSSVGSRATNFDVMAIHEDEESGEARGLGGSQVDTSFTVTAAQVALVGPGQRLTVEVEASNRFGNAEAARAVIVDRTGE